MAKKQLLNSVCGNRKGFIFTLDIALAILFVLIIIIASNRYTRYDAGSVESLHLTRLGSDIITALDNSNVLDTLAQSTILAKLDEITPVNFGIRLKIITINSGDLVVGDEIPDDRSISSGKRVFIISDPVSGRITDYAIVQYYIWLK